MAKGRRGMVKMFVGYVLKRRCDRYRAEKIASLPGKYLTKVLTRVFISNGEAQQGAFTHR
jgi:hypothetical protein